MSILWPPPPLVEDEEVALARELSVSSVRNSEDNKVPCRGSVDQNPIIQDIDEAHNDNKSFLKNATNFQAHDLRHTVPQKIRKDPTSPSTAKEPSGEKSSEAYDLHCKPCTQADHPCSSSAQRSKSTTRVPNRSRSRARPKISRIKTDVAVQQRATEEPNFLGSGHSPANNLAEYDKSPYGAFTPQIQRTESPIPLPSPRKHDASHHLSADADDVQLAAAEMRRGRSRNSTSTYTHSSEISQSSRASLSNRHVNPCEHKDERPIRSHTALLHPTDGLASPHKDTSRARATNQDLEAREQILNSSRHTSRTRDHSYVSSAERLSKPGHTLERPKANTVRRRSTHRTERPRPSDSLYDLNDEHDVLASMNQRIGSMYDSDRYSDRLTPPYVSVPKDDKDYFCKAFSENAARESSKHTPSSSTEIGTHSVPTSPPRTPKYDYFRSRESRHTPPSSPHRPSLRSRPPSTDETQLRELRAHTSLLSQATTGAAVAARTSPSNSRIPSVIDTTMMGIRRNGVSSKPTSRASSPTRTMTPRSPHVAVFPPSELPRGDDRHESFVASARPSTRDAAQRTESSAAKVYQLQHGGSSTGTGSYDEVRKHQMGLSPSTKPMVATLPTHLAAPPVIRRANSVSAPADTIQGPSRFSLPQCFRSEPTRDYQDWISIEGMPWIDFCKPCAQAVRQIRRYEPLLHYSYPKALDQETRCAMSTPWIRFAFLECIEQGRSTLNMLGSIQARLRDPRQACPGPKSQVRKFYKVIDPYTRRGINDFHVCQSCVFNIKDTFLELKNLFDEDTMRQERPCSMHTAHRQWPVLLRALSEANRRSRNRGTCKAEYLQPFAELVRQISVVPLCQHDTLLEGRLWHYHTDLPDFTICEACYREVVLPQYKHRMAKKITPVLELVPSSRSRSEHVSRHSPPHIKAMACQLYSDRMRGLFQDAIDGRIAPEEFEKAVTTRVAVQYSLAEHGRNYSFDQRLGIDRGRDIENNRQIWKKVE